MPLKCANCHRLLKNSLWKDQGEYFIPCFSCGVKNLVVPMLQIVGWQHDQARPLPQRQKAPSSTPAAV